MRLFRVLAVGALSAGCVVMLAPGASGSVPAAPKACKSLQALDKQLNTVLDNSAKGNYNSGEVKSLGNGFKKAAKNAPKAIRSTMNSIASVASDAAAAGNAGAAAQVIQKESAKFTAAAFAWGSYITKTCAATTTPSS